MQSPAVVEALHKEQQDQLVHLVVCSRAAFPKTQAYTDKVSQGLSCFRTEEADAVCLILWTPQNQTDLPPVWW